MKKNYLSVLAPLSVVAMPLLAEQRMNQNTPQVHGELILYKEQNFNGETATIDNAMTTVRTQWNIRSLSVFPGDRWQICARPRFREPCIILTRSVADASMIGIEGQIGSARQAPETPPAQGN